MESFTEAFIQFLPERDAGHLANTALMPYRTAKPYFELVQRLRLWTEYKNERCFLCNDNPSCESLCKNCAIVGLCVDCHFVVQGTFTWAPAEEEGWLTTWRGDSMCLMCGIDTEVLGAKWRRYEMLQAVMGWHRPIPVKMASTAVRLQLSDEEAF